MRVRKDDTGQGAMTGCGASPRHRAAGRRSRVGRAQWRDRRTGRGVGNARHNGCGVGAQAVLRSHAGNIFTLCMISGPSARKTALDGKIPAPCIQNNPIAPGNGHMGRRCCHFYPKIMHRTKILPVKGLIAHIRRKGNAYGAILASWP